jgi:hypothetical protein
MKLFKCSHCNEILHFNNRQCLGCGRRVGFLPSSTTLQAVEPASGGWCVAGSETRYHFCTNREFDTCNWLVEEAAPEKFCVACRHNRIIPNLGSGDNLQKWRKVEAAKHHLVYSLLRLRLALATREAEPETGLAFDILADEAEPLSDCPSVMTGHDSGVITLSLAEADDAVRETRRIRLGESYRTLLGHFRHEIGHYFWDRLLQGSDRLPAFRDLFGDETQDYDAALKSYYGNGPAPDWQESYVTAYASSHPWEDFAETWAHYLHIVDTLEMAGACGLRIQPTLDRVVSDQFAAEFDPHCEGTIDQIVGAWLPVALTVNSLNRCMGQPDLYPFILTPPVVAKLGFIHDLIRRRVPVQTMSAAA